MIALSLQFYYQLAYLELSQLLRYHWAIVICLKLLANCNFAAVSLRFRKGQMSGCILPMEVPFDETTGATNVGSFN